MLIKKPGKSGSLYFNYKKSFSMLLLGVCDHQYRLSYVSFGDYGSDSDGRVFERSDFREMLDNGTLGIPPAAPLPGTQLMSEHFFIADAAFPTTEHIMKPLPGALPTMEQRVYNYRYKRTASD